MAEPIDRALIQHVAQLAFLSLTDAEGAKLTQEIGAILRYVDELAALDTADVPPTAYVQLQSAAWREDEVIAGVAHDRALSQAPRASQGGFAVPAFVESEE
jgi:aspartyl-tRNA(Asn)/glutamyl-tRNA(Gln) amidotransferase subunit C